MLYVILIIFGAWIATGVSMLFMIAGSVLTNREVKDEKMLSLLETNRQQRLI